MIELGADQSGATPTAPSASCPICGSDVQVVFDAGEVPLHNSTLFDDKGSAVAAPSGLLILGACSECGFITNTAFDASLAEYGLGYEDSQASSAYFMQFARELAHDLDARYHLARRTVLEVGCGKGDFLRLLCGLADTSGIGIDPAAPPSGGDERSRIIRRPVETIAATACDLVVCRHTLEHVGRPVEFLEAIRRVVPDGTPLYLEVPDAGRILTEGAFWDVYYEHCSYFTDASLRHTLERSGFEVTETALTFGGQYLQAWAISRADAPSGAARAPTESDGEKLAHAFGEYAEEFRQVWSDRFVDWAAAGKRVALWAATSKTVSFLSALGIRDVAAVVDINAAKTGKFLPQSGLQVQTPEELASTDPDVVVVMNPVYESEIRDDLKEMGLSPEVLAP